MADAEADEVRLVSAIAQAAPYLRIRDMRLRGEPDLLPHFSPFLAALTGVETLRIELPLLLENALALVGGSWAFLRKLNLWCTRYSLESTAKPPAQLALYISRPPLRRSVTLGGFDVGDEDQNLLLERCRARRIRCNV